MYKGIRGHGRGRVRKEEISRRVAELAQDTKEKGEKVINYIIKK